ncbi:hypothetical protein MP638_006515 [Amoeboaphelidium occidentale]|nr:hypothetical protein MP638_006515 [Amoeboaphelidium occidentale]
MSYNLNKLRLELLLNEISLPIIRDIFLKRISTYLALSWETKEEAIRKSLQQNFALTKDQKKCVSSEDLEKWDVTLLLLLLLTNTKKYWRCSHDMDSKRINEALMRIREIRNFLAHTLPSDLSDAVFSQKWSTLKSLLLGMGADQVQIDIIKSARSLDDLKTSASVASQEEAAKLKVKGNECYRKKEYNKAVEYYTLGIQIVGIQKKDLAVLYSNRAACYLRLLGQNNYSQGLQDAGMCIDLWNEWWKGYYRKGQLFAAMKRNNEALEAFDRALALDHGNSEVKSERLKVMIALDTERATFDPASHPRSLDEQILDFSTQSGLNLGPLKDLIGKTDDPCFNDLLQAHSNFHAGNFGKAFTLFSKCAGKGNADAQYNLGLLLYKGMGCTQDVAAGVGLWKAAASSPLRIMGVTNPGVLEAMHSLGKYYEFVATLESQKECLYWYEQAVEHGFAPSANNLGLLYKEGKFVLKDVDKAAQYFEFSALGGDTNAMYNLADYWLAQRKDFKRAMEWNDRSANHGNVAAISRRAEFNQHCNEML